MSNTSTASARSERDRERMLRIQNLRQGGPAAVSDLLEELGDAGWAVRRAIIAALAEADAPALTVLCQELVSSRTNEAKISGIVDALSSTHVDVDAQVLELTRNPNYAVICDAAQILGRRGSLRALPTLQQLTAHPDDNVALAAVESLGRIGGNTAVDALLALVESRNFFRGFPAIDVLGRSGDPRAIPVLLKLVPDPLYGSEAVRALGRLGDQSTAPPLVDHLSRAVESLVRPLAIALATIHERLEQRFGTGIAVERALRDSRQLPALRQRLLQSLKRADSSEQVALSKLLSWIGDETTLPSLLALLESSGTVAQVAGAALKKLAGVAEPILVEAVRNGSSAQRRLLVPILAGRLAARDALIECLRDDDPAVRALACDTLARTSDASASPALFELLGDADARVAQTALGAIQSLGGNHTLRLALDAARSSDTRVRCAGLRIIGYFGHVEGLELAVEAARDPDERVRDAALAALPFIDDVGATAALIRATQHESARTRASAARALGQTAGEPILLDELRKALRDKDAWVRYYACQSLGKLRDDAATEAMAELLTDASGQVRVSAVEALAHLRGARAFEVLSAVLGSEDADLQRAALVALGISKRREALPKLFEALASARAETRLVALSALAELGFPEAIPAIARAMQDADEGVRVAAAGFLAARSDASATNELILLLVKNPTSGLLMHALSRPVPGRVEALAGALQSADDELAGALVACLARMQSEEASLAILSALGSANDAARRAAGSALGAMQDPSTAAALERAALSDPDAEVRRICAASAIR